MGNSIRLLCMQVSRGMRRKAHPRKSNVFCISVGLTGEEFFHVRLWIYLIKQDLHREVWKLWEVVVRKGIYLGPRLSSRSRPSALEVNQHQTYSGVCVASRKLG
jgi:hypothetical protein